MPRRKRREDSDLLAADTPRFRSYEEEAAWWDKNLDRILEEDFRRSERNGDDVMQGRMPHFRSEAEEAAWWDKYGTRIAEKGIAYLKAKRQRKLKQVALRLPEGDLTLARAQAKQQGVRYQSYLRNVIHSALQNEAKKTRKVSRAVK